MWRHRSSPLTRSSHHAGEDFEQLKAARAKKSARLKVDAPIDIAEMAKLNPLNED